jgi:hypothetical protein
MLNSRSRRTRRVSSLPAASTMMATLKVAKPASCMGQFGIRAAAA